MLFNAMVVQELLYGVEEWGDPVSLSAWNETYQIQNLYCINIWELILNI